VRRSIGAFAVVLLLVASGGPSSARAGVTRPTLEFGPTPPLRAVETNPAAQLLAHASRQWAAAIRADLDANLASYDGEMIRKRILWAREAWLRLEARAHVDLAVEMLEHPARRTVRSYALVAFGHRLVGREDRARLADRALVELCRRCPEAAEAHLRLADHVLATAPDADSLAPAIEHFGAAIAADVATAEVSTVIRAYAHYKLAWCLYNLGDHAATEAHLRIAAGLAEQTPRLRPMVPIVARDLDSLATKGLLIRRFI
jgi:hypothetical protein